MTPLTDAARDLVDEWEGATEAHGTNPTDAARVWFETARARVNEQIAA